MVMMMTEYQQKFNSFIKYSTWMILSGVTVCVTIVVYFLS